MKFAYLFAFYVAMAFAVDLAMTQKIYAQTVDPAAASALAVSVSSAQPAASASAVVQPAAVVAAVPPAIAPVAEVPVAAPAAPPAWAQDFLVTVQSLPIAGPIISKVVLYAGIVSSILTALVACVLTILSALSSVLSVAGLADLVTKIQAFKSGKIMYWLSYLSMFNAKKPSA